MDESVNPCMTHLCIHKDKDFIHLKVHMASLVPIYTSPLHTSFPLLPPSSLIHTYPSQQITSQNSRERETYMAKMNVSEAFKSRSMKSMLGDHLLRNGLSKLPHDQTTNSNLKLLPAPSHNADTSFISNKSIPSRSIFSTMNKLVKGKLRLGADKVFRQIFSVREGEQLLKTIKCCLFTTAGPIAGRVFISTDKLAFCSDRAITRVSTPTGDSLRFHYKIVIPLRKIKRYNQSENTKKPSQKYLHLVTSDDFEFWFTGFPSYKKTLSCLQKAVSNA